MPWVTFGVMALSLILSCGGSGPPGNSPPVIETFSVQPTSGSAPLSITINCYATDPDGIVVNYLFDYDGDGEEDFKNRFGFANTVLGKAGRYEVSCMAVDDLGAKSTKTQEVVVTDPLTP